MTSVNARELYIDLLITSLNGELSDEVLYRRHQFDKNSYRQPVLTQRPLKPKNYRRGQPDAEADRVRTRLRELQDYDLMEESEAGPGASAASGLDAPALA